LKEFISQIDGDKGIMWDFKKCDEVEAALERRMPLSGCKFHGTIIFLYRKSWWHHDDNLWLRDEASIWGWYENLEEIKVYLKGLKKADKVRILSYL